MRKLKGQWLILFLYCFFGKIAIENFEKMADCLYDVNWPELGVKWQKYIVIMIACSQKPRYYHGIGLAILKLETFSRVWTIQLTQMTDLF